MTGPSSCHGWQIGPTIGIGIVDLSRICCFGVRDISPRNQHSAIQQSCGRVTEARPIHGRPEKKARDAGNIFIGQTGKTAARHENTAIRLKGHARGQPSGLHPGRLPPPVGLRLIDICRSGDALPVIRLTGRHQYAAIRQSDSRVLPERHGQRTSR